VVDGKNCEKQGIYCPMHGEPSYKKYCCLGSSGYSCCNPYLGIIIGMSIGIPLLILVIVAIAVTCCVWHYYHNRKMRTLMVNYYRQRREEEHQRETRLLAPPPYSVLLEEDEEHTNRDLPAYSETDPFQASTSSEDSPSPEGQNSGANDTAVVERPTEAVESEQSGEGGTEQSTCDRAPLLGEGDGGQ
jgi:hypothetical protein